MRSKKSLGFLIIECFQGLQFLMSLFHILPHLLLLIFLLQVLLRVLLLLPTRNNIQVLLLRNNINIHLLRVILLIAMAEQETTINDTKNKCENMLQKKSSMFNKPKCSFMTASQRSPSA